MNDEHVLLPAGTSVLFPDLCVACGARGPDHKRWLRVLDRDSKVSMFCWLQAPMCRPCSSQFFARGVCRCLGWLLLFSGILAFFLVIPEEWRNDSAVEGVGFLLCGAAVLIMLAWDIFFPAPFTFSADKTLFTFRSGEVAEAFKKLNQPTEIAPRGVRRGDPSAPWPAWEDYQGGLGASIWEYCVPYQSDIQKALKELQEREFQAGRFYLGELNPKSLDEAIRNADAPGLRSILDISHVSDTRDLEVISPAPADALRQLFGTDRPTREMVERASREWTGGFGALLETYERGEGVYWILYENNQPVEIYFAGWSYD